MLRSRSTCIFFISWIRETTTLEEWAIVSEPRQSRGSRTERRNKQRHSLCRWICFCLCVVVFLSREHEVSTPTIIQSLHNAYYWLLSSAGLIFLELDFGSDIKMAVKATGIINVLFIYVCIYLSLQHIKIPLYLIPWSLNLQFYFSLMLASFAPWKLHCAKGTTQKTNIYFLSLNTFFEISVIDFLLDSRNEGKGNSV